LELRSTRANPDKHDATGRNMPTATQERISVAEFFDQRYSLKPHYWWREDHRYATDPNMHATSLITQMTLRLLAQRSDRRTKPPRPRALDLGAGEGADSIRLALLGYDVDAVEVSEIGAKKIAEFAAEEGVQVNVQVADLRSYQAAGDYDVVLCNGVLHYIEHKAPVVKAMQRATRMGGLNVVSLWSTYTPVPPWHEKVPVFCDDEDGIVRELYQDWNTELLYFERAKRESAHSEMPDHTHSHIKLIARKA
jgi:2-polyprenyl-3-methyl-5-hydroxy-6-metoxy-1,4-benzoquinol methylase